MAAKKAKKTVKKTTVKKPATKPAAKITTVKAVTKNKKNFFVSSKTFIVNNNRTIGALVAEFVGTFMFVAFYMCTQGDPRYAMFALIGIALIIGGISGAAINPAMTISGLITKKIKKFHALGYIIAQALGAVAAWSVLSAYSNIVKADATSMMASSGMFKATAIVAGKEWFILFAEILGAAILAFGLATAIRMKKNDKLAGSIAYGLALYVAMFITYILVSPLGTGLVFFNPAIVFAAGGISWNVWPIAIYILAPIIGGVAGFVLNDIIFSQDQDIEKLQ